MYSNWFLFSCLTYSVGCNIPKTLWNRNARTTTWGQLCKISLTLVLTGPETRIACINSLPSCGRTHQHQPPTVSNHPATSKHETRFWPPSCYRHRVSGEPILRPSVLKIHKYQHGSFNFLHISTAQLVFYELHVSTEKSNRSYFGSVVLTHPAKHNQKNVFTISTKTLNATVTRVLSSDKTVTWRHSYLAGNW